MAEREGTIDSKIPRERLNQIAGRKLSALAVPVRLGADGETIEGELAFASRIVNPLDGRPVARAAFAVVGHDRLRFLEPPLAALSPVVFYDVERIGALEARLAELLQKRARLLESIATRFRALRLEATLDPDRLLVRAVVSTVRQAFELLGGDDGVRVSRVAPVGGTPFEVPASFPQVDLAEHATATDLELWLEGKLQEQLAAGGEQRSAGAALQFSSPPGDALTLGQMATAFGGDVVVAPGTPVEVSQEVEYGGRRYRFVAAREAGTRFRGRLAGPSGDVWSEAFDLAHFPGTAQVVAAALGVTPEQPRSGTPEQQRSWTRDLPEYLMPHPGEVWVMHVLIEEMSGDEVRYVGTDIDGRPYGAQRVLKKAAFEAVFSLDRGGYRLLVMVDQVLGGSVLYRQLDAQRQPMGGARKMPVSVMAANFVPEAAAY